MFTDNTNFEKKRVRNMSEKYEDTEKVETKVQQNEDATLVTESDNSPDTATGANERDKAINCDTEEENLHQQQKDPLDTFYKKIQMEKGLTSTQNSIT
jgi:hypothetical protein